MLRRHATAQRGGLVVRGEDADVESTNLSLAGRESQSATASVAVRSTYEFAATFDDMTHAVVNALNTIAAASELAKMMLARDDATAAAKPLASIELECMRAARLLRDGREFLTFDIQATHESVDVVALIRDCAEPFDDRVRIEAGAPAPRVTGDARMLHRLFSEIVRNAFQFGAQRLEVTVAERDGDLVSITFRDDGPGTTAAPTRLFEPFFSTEPAEHSGLGLAMAARIARANGGSVGMDAATHGASFRVRLPRHAS